MPCRSQIVRVAVLALSAFGEKRMGEREARATTPCGQGVGAEVGRVSRRVD